MFIHIGEFECRSGILAVTDPCHNTPQSLLNMKKGTYLVRVEEGMIKDCGKRVKAIYITHTEHKGDTKGQGLQTKGLKVMVDCGVFCACDTDTYHRGEIYAPEGDGSVWYDAVTGTVYTEKHRTTIILGGCACQSGLGDGCYDVLVQPTSQDSKIYEALKVRFI